MRQDPQGKERRNASGCEEHGQVKRVLCLDIFIGRDGPRVYIEVERISRVDFQCCISAGGVRRESFSMNFVMSQHGTAVVKDDTQKI